MRRKRMKIGQRKTAKKTINLLLCMCILLSIFFSIKYMLFNTKETAHASQEDIKVPNIPPNEIYPSFDSYVQNNNIDISKSTNKYIDTSKDIDQNEDEGSNKFNNEDENSNKSNDRISLENSVFIGDSITEALSYYKFVDSSNVIAHKGYTARKALSDIDKVVKLNPDNIFIMLGLNDILIERKVDRYINNYTNLINELKKSLPDTNIYIQSILPVGPEVKSSKLALSNTQIKEFNDGLMNLANQDYIYYLDVASVVNSYNGNLHEPDGIHYKSKFCSIWLEYIKKNIQNP